MKSNMPVTYQINTPVTRTQFIDLLQRSTLDERRPVDDLACIDGMLSNSNLMVTAWDGHQLIGVARSVTDFHYACYLSDLAVCRSYQQSGVGKALQRLTQQQLGPRCKVILLAAPTAHDYYGHIGYTQHHRCWVLERDAEIQTTPASVRPDDRPA
jgi:predicted N-acetyltransferase YhbS